jgi:chromosome segregation ATPase
VTFGQHEAPGDHTELEQSLAEAEMDLAKKLEELSDLELQIGRKNESDHHLVEAIDLQKRAKEHIDHRVQALKDAIQSRNNQKPKR